MPKDKSDDTQQLLAVKPDPTVKGFAARIESLMNEAYQQSQVEGEHQQKFANWCNHLGDLWREVKKHA